MSENAWQIPKHIRGFAFDAVGTVLFPTRGAPQIYAEAAARYGINDTSETIRRRFSQAYLQEEAYDAAAGWVTNEAREVERWRAIVSAALPGSPEECFQSLYQHFSQPHAWQPPADAQLTFEKLQQLGYTLGLGSNYDRRLFTVLDGLAELQLLREHILISSVLGVRKPGATFFLELAKHMDLKPSELCFVGDDLQNDYHGAQAAGLFAVHLGNSPSTPPDLRSVASLSDLLERLG